MNVFAHTLQRPGRAGVILLAALIAGGTWGCGGSQDPTSPVTPGVPLVTAQEGRSTPLSTEAIDAINLAIQDEYRAHFTYARVVADFGEVQPFSKTVQAEWRHVSAIGRLFTKHLLPVPDSAWNETNVPTYSSVLDACVASRDGELANVAMYDALLALGLQEEVTKIFTKLRNASLDKHVPAFERCIKRES